MSDSSAQALTLFGGEFRDSERETAFQTERLSETLRHTRLLFILSAVLNVLFLISDWRFYGQPHFYAAVSARLMVVGVSIACYLAAQRAKDFRSAEKTMIAWEWINAGAVSVLVSSHSDLALFVVIMLPSIYYLVLPTSFRWSVASGIGCSVLMLLGYMSPEDVGTMLIGLALAMAMLNFALILVVARSNRLRRLEWAALQAERRARSELADSRAMFENLFKTVPMPLVVSKEDGSIVNVNDAGISYFGVPREALGIRSTTEIYVNPEDRSAFLAKLQEHGKFDDFETLIRLGNGSVRNVLLAGTRLEIAGEEYIISGLVDITERKATEERIWRAASHDSLTDLPNRALFQSRLEQALAEAKHMGEKVTLLLIDLDDFKSINDALGHDAGDHFLQRMADRLRSLVDKDDTVARLGGDEFVIILNASDRTSAFIETLMNELGRPIAYNGKEMISGASVGVAVFPDHDTAPSDLLKDADLALYAAKSRGRNCAVVYSPDMRSTIERRVTLAREVREALEQRRIVPYYQPKVNIVTGEIIGFEALARWQHAELGLLAPLSFSAAFEEPELSIALGEQMIRQVTDDMRHWRESGVQCGRIAVNLSTTQFSWLGLAKRFLEIVHQADIDPRQLEVEITETVFLGRGSAHVAAVLKEFHDNGVRIALDDFGTGYASLIHLKQFPVDDIKIDQSFVKDIEHNAESAAIVTAVLELGKSLHMDVIAEGVETPAQAQFLRDRGCVFVQGNLFATPMAAADVPAFLEKQRSVLV